MQKMLLFSFIAGLQLLESDKMQVNTLNLSGNAKQSLCFIVNFFDHYYQF